MPIEQNTVVPGTIIEGKVQGITKFGAFIELPGGIVGLVHISEIADTYVKDVKDFIKEGDSVKVKVLNVAGKKVGLSIKQAVPPKKVEKTEPVVRRSHPTTTLDDKIAKFLKESDERMQPLKNKLEPRKRSRYN
jgi:S1 RNA binding domain protein